MPCSTSLYIKIIFVVKAFGLLVHTAPHNSFWSSLPDGKLAVPTTYSFLSINIDGDMLSNKTQHQETITNEWFSRIQGSASKKDEIPRCMKEQHLFVCVWVSAVGFVCHPGAKNGRFLHVCVKRLVFVQMRVWSAKHVLTTKRVHVRFG